jgi:hypothetical protein
LNVCDSLAPFLLLVAVGATMVQLYVYESCHHAISIVLTNDTPWFLSTYTITQALVHCAQDYQMVAIGFSPLGHAVRCCQIVNGDLGSQR